MIFKKKSIFAVVFILLFLVLSLVLAKRASNSNDLRSISKNDNREKKDNLTPIQEEKLFDSLLIQNGTESQEFKLVYSDKDLLLKCADKQYIIEQNQEYVHIEETPKLHFISSKNKDYVLITIVWQTNKIGSSVTMWGFDIMRESVFDINDGIELMDYSIEENSKINIEKYNKKLDAKIDKQFSGVYENSGSFDLSRHVEYEIKDINFDGENEIITKRIISTGAIEWFPYDFVETQYKLIDDNMVPIEVTFK